MKLFLHLAHINLLFQLSSTVLSTIKVEANFSFFISPPPFSLHFLLQLFHLKKEILHLNFFQCFCSKNNSNELLFTSDYNLQYGKQRISSWKQMVKVNHMVFINVK